MMKPSMLARLDQLANRLEEINSLLMQEGVTDNMEQYRKLNREHAELGPLVDTEQPALSPFDGFRSCPSLSSVNARSPAGCHR